MSNNKQSSVEWLLDNLHLQNSTKWTEIVEQAKAMHKEEIEEAFWDGSDGLETNTDIRKIAEQYYNETFNTKEK